MIMTYFSVGTRLAMLLASLFALCFSYVPPDVRDRWKAENYDMTKALKTIEERAPLREEKDFELYYASRYIDRNAHLFYSDKESRNRLWEQATGSWELLMGYEDPRRDQFFVPYPDFRDFAMAYIIIDPEDNYFGKGIAQGPSFSFVAMGGPSKVNERTRQLYMDYQDFYISGQLMPDWDLSYFMRGYARNWEPNERKRPPLAFTLIGVTNETLIVRGSKTGGMAIFRRIKDDMRPAAYGFSDWKERVKGLWNWKGEK